MKKRVLALILMVCTGIFLLNGCVDGGVEENTPDSQISDPKYTQDEDEIKPNNNAEIPENENEDIPENDHEGNDLDDSLSSANDVFESVDLMGNVTEYSDSGCTIEKLLIDGDSSVPSGSSTIVYEDEILFQAGTFKSDGSTYSLETCDKGELNDGAFVLVFGSLQDDDTYLAAKIIIVEYDYS